MADDKEDVFCSSPFQFKIIVCRVLPKTTAACFPTVKEKTDGYVFRVSLKQDEVSQILIDSVVQNFTPNSTKEENNLSTCAALVEPKVTQPTSLERLGR